MKRYLGALLLISGTASAADLSCYGEYVWTGDQGTDKAAIVASFERPGTLSAITETIQEIGDDTPVVYTYESLAADPAYKPTAKKYEGYDRYPLSGGSGWTNYYLLLPKTLGSAGSSIGYLQRVGHDSYPTITLDCTVE